MALVYDIDYSDEIARLPKHAGYSTLPARTGEQYVTLHYSGVDYPPTSEAGELQRILDEASYQMHHNYGSSSAPAYPDGLLYDLVVLTTGKRVLTRKNPQQLWHVGNATGNKKSWAIHVMTGPKTDVTQAQWSGVVNLLEQLLALEGILKTNVVGHNEWPRHDGLPQPSSTYRLLPEQSECPGKLIHQRLAQWRAQPTDPLKACQIPGPHGTYFYCGTGFYDYYASHDGLWSLGYPEEHEVAIVDQGGKTGTKQRFERGWLKYIPGEGVRPALRSEALALKW